MEYLIEGSTLTALADVIRYKAGITKTMNPADMVTEIEKMHGASDNCIMFLSDDYSSGGGSNFTLSASVTWDGLLEYSTDKKTWYTWDDGHGIISSNGKLYLRGSGNTTFFNDDDYNGVSFELIGPTTVGCYGNINTLLDYSNPPTTLTMDNYQCYMQMFYDCILLSHAPELPATTLVDSCYNQMFYGCTSLTQAPELPATNLAVGCYCQMFYGCTSLSKPAALPAITLTNKCYYQMFYGCRNIILYSSAPSGVAVSRYRIPTFGTGTDSYLANALQGMFTSTGGSWTGTPSINTTYYIYDPNGTVLA